MSYTYKVVSEGVELGRFFTLPAAYAFACVERAIMDQPVAVRKITEPEPVYETIMVSTSWSPPLAQVVGHDNLPRWRDSLLAAGYRKFPGGCWVKY